MKKSIILIYKSFSNIFQHIARSEISWQFARDRHFFINWNIDFFHSSGKISLSEHDLKIIQGVYILMVHILLTFICLFYHDHVLSLNLSFDLFLGCHCQKRLHQTKTCVLSKSSDVRLLPLLITVHCFAKNELNNYALFVKSAINLFS